MISIVIITLNEADQVKKLLGDISKQKYKDIEVIVVDGNSKDNTKKTVLGFKKKISNLKFYVQKKRGVSLARNTGAKLAKGEYIIFMDADISFGEDFVEKAITDMEKKGLKAAGVYMKSMKSNLVDVFYYSFLNFWFWIMQKIYPHCVGSCVISTKQVHKKIKGFDETVTMAEDNDYVNRARKYGKYGMINQSVLVSPRRFEKEGRFKMGLKYMMVFFYRIFFGEIKTDIFKYRFGHYGEK
jgi:hypothetical protein